MKPMHVELRRLLSGAYGRNPKSLRAPLFLGRRLSRAQSEFVLGFGYTICNACTAPALDCGCPNPVFVRDGRIVASTIEETRAIRGW